MTKQYYTDLVLEDRYIWAVDEEGRMTPLSNFSVSSTEGATYPTEIVIQPESGAPWHSKHKFSAEELPSELERISALQNRWIELSRFVLN